MRLILNGMKCLKLTTLAVIGISNLALASTSVGEFQLRLLDRNGQPVKGLPVLQYVESQKSAWDLGSGWPKRTSKAFILKQTAMLTDQNGVASFEGFSTSKTVTTIGMDLVLPLVCSGSREEQIKINKGEGFQPNTFRVVGGNQNGWVCSLTLPDLQGQSRIGSEVMTCKNNSTAQEVQAAFQQDLAAARSAGCRVQDNF